MRFFRFGCLGIVGLLIILSVAPRQIMKAGIRSANWSPDGKYAIAIVRHQMLFSMPGGGSDAPCDVFLFDAAGKELNSRSVDMVQLVSVHWQGDRVRIGDILSEWQLPKIDNINILLFSAAYTGNLLEVQKLLAKNADIHFKTYLDQTLLHAAAAGPNQAVVQLFLQKGLDVRDLDKAGQTPLHAAAAGRSSGAIDLLIASGADIEAIDRSEYGETALNIAAESGNYEAMKALINRGAHVKDNTFFSVINRFTSEKQKQEIIELLLNNEAKIPSGLLYSAVSRGGIDIVKLLIDRGADVNAPDDYDRTTLLMRILQPNTGISPQSKPALVKLFLSKGADVNARNKNGATALSIAYKSSTPEIVKLLKQHGAKI
jgi:ankyrin repeat protein